jgi:hypothetical protein
MSQFQEKAKGNPQDTILKHRDVFLSINTSFSRYIVYKLKIKVYKSIQAYFFYILLNIKYSSHNCIFKNKKLAFYQK